MDINTILNSDLVKELDNVTDQNIDKEQIVKVLSEAMPAIMNNQSATRSADTEGTKSAASLLFNLLGDNSNSVTESVAQNTGVPSNSVASILTSAAPFLLKLLASGNQTTTSNSSSSSASGLDGLTLLTSLLGLGGKKEETAVEQPEEKKNDLLGGILNTVSSILGDK